MKSEVTPPSLQSLFMFSFDVGLGSVAEGLRREVPCPPSPPQKKKKKRKREQTKFQQFWPLGVMKMTFLFFDWFQHGGFLTLLRLEQ